ncbi:MAG: DUF4282 domain-containing protein [Novosphingobium sp.]
MDKNFAVSDLTSFDKLIAPKVLKIVYWIGLAGIAVACLLSFVGALGMLQYSASMALGTMLFSVLGFAFGVLFWRILIEIYMVFFGIYDRLGEIKATLEAKP